MSKKRDKGRIDLSETPEFWGFIYKGECLAVVEWQSVVREATGQGKQPQLFHFGHHIVGNKKNYEIKKLTLSW